ncbi:MAG: helix-turn-helix domain-containing protein [Stellaceae bacterium]
MSITSRGLGDQPERLLYTAAETERLLGISHATLYRLLARSRLSAVKVGAATRITASSIERYLASLPPAQMRERYTPAAE